MRCTVDCSNLAPRIGLKSDARIIRFEGSKCPAFEVRSGLMVLGKLVTCYVIPDANLQRTYSSSKAEFESRSFTLLKSITRTLLIVITRHLSEKVQAVSRES